MNETTPYDTKYTGWLLMLADNLKQAIQTRLLDLVEFQEKLDLLQGHTCTGRPHWRDSIIENLTTKLYIIHSVDASCPLHGTPMPGKRVCTYIGSKPEKIETALAAIEREKERRDLEYRHSILLQDLHALGYHLRNCYNNLDYQVPKPGEDGLPEPQYKDEFE